MSHDITCIKESNQESYPCPSCQGTGWMTPQVMICLWCEGSGRVTADDYETWQMFVPPAEQEGVKDDGEQP